MIDVPTLVTHLNAHTYEGMIYGQRAANYNPLFYVNTSNSFEIPMKYSLFCTQNQCHSWLAQESRGPAKELLDA